ncbi:MAG: hypothetical protein RL591_1767 [Planctomycetota bacterium]|jgi:prepilin-type N-terminal cleavage/methylation domain-containing protein
MIRRRGFTLVEVMVAAGLLAIVGFAIVAFVTAFARGAQTRARVSDPAIEGSLLVERFRALQPSTRTTLANDEHLAAIWLSDRVPSRTVHLSELGWLRFCATSGDVVLERVDEDRFLDDRALESEFASSVDFLALRDDMLGENLLVSTILAEGLDDVRFVEASREKRGETRSELLIELEAEHAVARLVLSHANPEEPLR